MTQSSKSKLTILIILLSIAAVGVTKIVISSSSVNESIVIQQRSKGSKEALIKITEFIDFQCPACAAGAIYLKKYMEDHPGQIYLEMKYFPLQMHPNAYVAARYAQCALEQGQFWPYHDALVEQQKQWEKLTDAHPAFVILSEDVGMNQKKLQACLENSAIDEVIEKDKAEGKILGVRSTPTYFVNGEMIVGMTKLREKLESL